MKNFTRSVFGFWAVFIINIVVTIFLITVSDNIVPDSIKKGMVSIVSGMLTLTGVIIFTMRRNVKIQSKIRPAYVITTLIFFFVFLWFISVAIWGIKTHIVPMITIGIWYVVGILHTTKLQNEKEDEILEKPDS